MRAGGAGDLAAVVGQHVFQEHGDERLVLHHEDAQTLQFRITHLSPRSAQIEGRVFVCLTGGCKGACKGADNARSAVYTGRVTSIDQRWMTLIGGGPRARRFFYWPETVARKDPPKTAVSWSCSIPWPRPQASRSSACG